MIPPITNRKQKETARAPPFPLLDLVDRDRGRRARRPGNPLSPSPALPPTSLIPSTANSIPASPRLELRAAASTAFD